MSFPTRRNLALATPCSSVSSEVGRQLLVLGIWYEAKQACRSLFSSASSGSTLHGRRSGADGPLLSPIRKSLAGRSYSNCHGVTTFSPFGNLASYSAHPEEFPCALTP